jgi:tetratricopeptide (TPR) repeat protein
MSPEQATGAVENIGPPSDIYSLGAMLYEILTGRVAFSGTSTDEILVRLRRESPEPPAQAARGVPKPLNAVCLKAMALDPQERYASANELAQDIQRWLADEPVQAHREPLWDRLWRWERRHKAWVIGGAALVLTAAALVVAFVLVHERLIREEQKRTEEAKQRAERNYKAARLAVEGMLDKVGGERLANVPGMDQVRRPLLEQARNFYEEFARDRQDDPNSLIEGAVAYRRLGDIYYLLGQNQEARAAYVKGQALLEGLAADGDTEARRRKELALTLHQLAWLLHRRTDQPQQAGPMYRQCLALWSGLLAEAPSDAEYQKELAHAHHDLGLLLQITDRAADAEDHFRQAQSLRQALVQTYPGNAEYQRALAQVHNDLGLLIREREGGAAAKPEYEEAIKLLRRAVADYAVNPQLQHEFPDCQRELAATCNNLGLLLSAKDREGARAVFAEARQLGESLVERFATRQEYRLELARCLVNEGLLLANADELADARARSDAAAKHYQRLVQDHPGVPDYASELGLTLNNLALIASKEKNLKACRTHLEAAVAHQQTAWRANPKNPAYRERLRLHYRGLADTCILLSDHAAATATAKDLAAVSAGSASDLVAAAGYYSRCVRLALKDTELPESDRRIKANSYADAAVPLLRQAAQAGWTDHSVLDKEEFQPIRERPEVKQLR